MSRSVKQRKPLLRCFKLCSTNFNCFTLVRQQSKYFSDRKSESSPLSILSSWIPNIFFFQNPQLSKLLHRLTLVVPYLFPLGLYLKPKKDTLTKKQTTSVIIVFSSEAISFNSITMFHGSFPLLHVHIFQEFFYQPVQSNIWKQKIRLFRVPYKKRRNNSVKNSSHSTCPPMVDFPASKNHGKKHRFIIHNCKDQ